MNVISIFKTFIHSRVPEGPVYLRGTKSKSLSFLTTDADGKLAWYNSRL
jgi:hypothetical protein